MEPANGNPKVGTGTGTIVIERDEIKIADKFLTPYNVICWDDPVHTMDEVVELFQRLFGFDNQKAVKKMLEVHLTGKSIVWTGLKERAEYYREAIENKGLTATMEPA
jgi:ATP-dependent Clp protease adaptor protein ClpS